jgi:hypothetical protein
MCQSPSIAIRTANSFLEFVCCPNKRRKSGFWKKSLTRLKDNDGAACWSYGPLSPSLTASIRSRPCDIWPSSQSPALSIRSCPGVVSIWLSPTRGANESSSRKYHCIYMKSKNVLMKRYKRVDINDSPNTYATVASGTLSPILITCRREVHSWGKEPASESV